MKPARLLAPLVAAAVAVAALAADAALAAPVTAPDGAARGYETPPHHPPTPAGLVLRGARKGAGLVLRALVWPLRATARVESRYQLRRRGHALFWNDADTIGVFPSASYATSGGPRIGARAVVLDPRGGGWLTLAADTGSIVKRSLQLRAGAPLGGIAIAARLRYDDHEGLMYHGIGNDAGNVEARFAQQRMLGVLQAGVERGPLRVGLAGIYDERTFGGAPPRGGVPDLTMAYDAGAIPGFVGGSRNLELTAGAELDRRDRRGATSRGGVARVFGGAGALTGDPYAHYGVELAYHVTPFWPDRVIGARVALEGVEPLDGGEVAFTDLPRLGGGRRLRGYASGRFRDRLATVGTLEYRYPVHARVSGELFVEAGKVAPTYDALAGDGLGDHWHTSVGGGLLYHTPSRIGLRLDIAYGDGLQLFIGTDVLDAFRDREHEL